jgi:hypothetical protein
MSYRSAGPLLARTRSAQVIEKRKHRVACVPSASSLNPRSSHSPPAPEKHWTEHLV